MQTVTVDGQEALFIPNMGAQANQLNGAQPIQIGNQQAFITPNGQIIRPGVMPANILQNMGQTVSLPTGKFHFLIPFNAGDNQLSCENVNLKLASICIYILLTIIGMG